MLKQEYKDSDISLDEALTLAVKVMAKTLDITKCTGDKFEMATLTRKDGATHVRVLSPKDVEVYIKKFEEEEAKSEGEKKKEKS